MAADNLKDAAKGTGITIGTAVNYKTAQTDTEYVAKIPEEFNIITPENSCKMTIIAKSYTDLDIS